MKLDKIFRTAVEYKASDIYITSGSKPILRVNGDITMIEDHPVITPDMAKEFIFETMDADQQNKFTKEMDIDFALNIPEVARFRVNAFWQRNGMAAVYRLVPAKIRTMDDLGLPQQLKKILQYKNGLVLVTGPTGCGKTTTLASIINELNITQKQHIITVEDPIEFLHENKSSVIDQREVGVHTTSFGRALKATMREDPDIILVGELRDLETIALAITAAETGHLVFGTLHTSGTSKTVDRVIDAFPPEQQNQIRSQFSENLRCVIWQTLVKRKDGKGRVAAYEIMFNNNAVSNMIRQNKTYQLPSVLETGMAEGMQTMKRSLMGLLEQGIISDETVKENWTEDLI